MVSFQSNESFFYTLTDVGLTKQNDADTTIGVTNTASDFISHRLLVSFYNYKNSEEINLFPVFEKDIIPFTALKDGKNLGELYSSIRKEKLFVESYGKVRNVSSRSNRYKNNQANIDRFNRELDSLVSDVNHNATKYFREQFDGGRDTYEIELAYKDKLTFSYIVQERTIDSLVTPFTSTMRDYNSPVITLTVRIKEGGKYQKIPKPQSFLNEAKLTGIALSIRFAVLETKPTSIDSKLIALDDLLVSLDMSHREPIIDLLIGRYMNDYQLFVFTHNLSFFSMLRKKLEQRGALGEWDFEQMTIDDCSGYDKPVVRSWETPFARAKRLLSEGDYVSAANQLRQEFEGHFVRIMPKERRYDGGKKIATMLGDILPLARPFFVDIGCDPVIVDRVGIYKDHLMNPLSHFNSDVNVYRDDFKKLFELAGKLDEIRSDVALESTKEVVLRADDQAAVKYIVTLELTQDLRKLKKNSNDPVSFLPTSCKMTTVQVITGGSPVNHKYNPNYSNKSLQQVYEDVCQFLETTFTVKITRIGDPLHAYSLPNATPIRNLMVF